MRFIDLSHAISDGMETYPGLPGPMISDHLSRAASRERYAPGTEFQIGRIDMVANTGTYIDTPFHRFADGHDLSALALERVAFVAGCSSTRRGRRSMPTRSAGLDLTDGPSSSAPDGTGTRALQAYGAGGHPHLTGGGRGKRSPRARRVVGIDSVNIDATSTGERPVHTALLARGIPIVEHLRGLEEIPDGPFTFTAVPVKVAGMGTFPVRRVRNHCLMSTLDGHVAIVTGANHGIGAATAVCSLSTAPPCSSRGCGSTSTSIRVFPMNTAATGPWR